MARWRLTLVCGALLIVGILVAAPARDSRPTGEAEASSSNLPSLSLAADGQNHGDTWPEPAPDSNHLVVHRQLEARLLPLTSHIEDAPNDRWHVEPIHQRYGIYIARQCIGRCGPLSFQASADRDSARRQPSDTLLLFTSPGSNELVTGFLFRSVRHLQHDDASVDLMIHDGVEKTLNSGFQARLSRSGADGVEDYIDLGTTYSLDIGELHCREFVSPLQVAPQSSVTEEELGTLLQSPESLRDRVDAHLVRLLEDATATINTAQASSGSSESVAKPQNGCVVSPLSQEEAGPMLSRVEEAIRDRRQILAENAVVFHRLLQESAPPRVFE